MKRSEMIGLIFKCLYDNSLKCSMLDGMDTAEAILTCVEDGGMLPPHEVFDSYEWESENEEDQEKD